MTIPTKLKSKKDSSSSSGSSSFDGSDGSSLDVYDATAASRPQKLGKAEDGPNYFESKRQKQLLNEKNRCEYQVAVLHISRVCS